MRPCSAARISSTASGRVDWAFQAAWASRGHVVRSALPAQLDTQLLHAAVERRGVEPEHLGRAVWATVPLQLRSEPVPPNELVACLSPHVVGGEAAGVARSLAKV